MRYFASRSALVAISALLVSATAPVTWAQDANAFNRLHAAPGDRNASPSADGVHDPALEGTQQLQSPKDSFAALPKAIGGNFVNWTEALRSGKVVPRFDRLDEKAKPELLDLDIVREVKGTTPPAVFPHAAHSEWVDCPVCHPALFEAEKGGNTMTMGEIMLGQKCGVCHGTVAFGINECRRCHYKPNSADAKTVSLKDSGKAKKGSRLPWKD